MHINVKIFHAFLYTFQGLADSLLAKGQGHKTEQKPGTERMEQHTTTNGLGPN